MDTLCMYVVCVCESERSLSTSFDYDGNCIGYLRAENLMNLATPPISIFTLSTSSTARLPAGATDRAIARSHPRNLPHAHHRPKRLLPPLALALTPPRIAEPPLLRIDIRLKLDAYKNRYLEHVFVLA